MKVRSLTHGPVSVWFWFPVAAGHGEHLATFRQPALRFLNALPDPQLLGYIPPHIPGSPHFLSSLTSSALSF